MSRTRDKPGAYPGLPTRQRKLPWPAAVASLALLAAAPPPVLLDGRGLVTSEPDKPPRRVSFGVTRKAAVEAVVAVKGRSVDKGRIADCGQGIAIAWVEFRGGLTLSFIDGRFAGYSVEGPGAMTKKGIAVGSSRQALARAYPSVTVDGDATDGFRWTEDVEDGLMGTISTAGDDSAVTSIVGGETCAVS